MAESLTNRYDFPITPANPADLDALYGVMEHANEFAAVQSAEHRPQWVNVNNARAGIRRHVEAGNCYAMRDGSGQIVASVSLTEVDAFAWGTQGIDGSAIYFYKLMRDPTRAPRGSGLKLLQFVAATALQRGRELVRCDLKPGNSKLTAWYEWLTFNAAGESVYPVADMHYVLMEANRAALQNRISQLQG